MYLFTAQLRNHREYIEVSVACAIHISRSWLKSDKFPNRCETDAAGMRQWFDLGVNVNPHR